MSTDTTTQYAYKCPECGDTERLDVSVTIWARLVQYDVDDFLTDPDEAEDGSAYWDDESTMVCQSCCYSGNVSEFNTLADEDDDDEEGESNA